METHQCPLLSTEPSHIAVTTVDCDVCLPDRHVYTSLSLCASGSCFDLLLICAGPSNNNEAQISPRTSHDSRHTTTPIPSSKRVDPTTKVPPLTTYRSRCKQSRPLIQRSSSLHHAYLHTRRNHLAMVPFRCPYLSRHARPDLPRSGLLLCCPSWLLEQSLAAARFWK
jgi:hypothetical protein